MAPYFRQNVALVLGPALLAGFITLAAIWILLPSLRGLHPATLALWAITAAGVTAVILLLADLVLRWADIRHILADAAAGALAFTTALMTGPGPMIEHAARLAGFPALFWVLMIGTGMILGALGRITATANATDDAATIPAPTGLKARKSEDGKGFGRWPAPDEPIDLSTIVRSDSTLPAGALRVRTCATSLLMGALVGGVVCHLIAYYTEINEPALVQETLAGLLEQISSTLPRMGKASVEVTGRLALGLLLFPLPLLLIHKLLQARAFTGHLIYGAAGGLLPILVGAMTQPTLHFTTLAYSAPLGLAALLYRTMAGVEVVAPEQPQDRTGLPERRKIPRALAGSL
jgi:hypothetical protein